MILSKEFLQNQSLPQVFERGLKAHQKGWEGKIEKYGSVYVSQMRGSSFYRLSMNIGSEEIQVNCSCPYDQGGWCKHLITMSLGILENKFDKVSTQFDPEQARSIDLVNINQLRDEFGKKEAAFFHEQIQEFIKGENFRNAMRVILGMYEGQQQYVRKNPESSSQIELEELLGKITNPFSNEPSDPKQIIAVLTPIFQRWDKYEQSLDLNFPEKSIRYNLNLFEDFMIELAKNTVAAQFLRIKMEGYSLSRDLLPRLRNVLY